MGKKFENLYDPEIAPKNIAGKKDLDEKARETVVRRFEQYDNARTFTRAAETINLPQEWDQMYRFYRGIYRVNDHSYVGRSKTFMSISRKSVNIIDSETSNALFTRDGYFSVDSIGLDSNNVKMSRTAFSALKYYSDLENYVKAFQLCLKQCLIYGATCVESLFIKKRVEGVFRRKDVVPVEDENGDILRGVDGKVVTRDEFNIVEVSEDISSIKIEVRDIYKMYIDHRLEDPSDGDVIFRDSKTASELLEMADRGVYNARAIEELLKEQPSSDSNSGSTNTQTNGDGKTFIDHAGLSTEDEDTSRFEILRFQGFFTTENEETGQRIKEQYWIDLGEREHVLRIVKNPLLGGFKTFTFVNYDSMVSEFYTDGVIEPIRAIQIEINDKENQSIDALTFSLQAPIEVAIDSGLTQADIMAARKTPHYPLMVRKVGSINKLQFPVPLNHLNSELQRLNSMADLTTGATSIAGGAPTGTQADRSGKALTLLQNQTRSQFSRFVRKFERDLIQSSLQKNWNMILQFIDEDILIEIMGDDHKTEVKTQNPAEIVGQFNIRVSGGSQFLKEREVRDSILEFIAIIGTDDRLRQMVNLEEMLRDIAAAMPHNMSKYIDPKNLINQMQNQIDQLVRALEATGNIGEVQQKEIQRLRGVVQQTKKLNEALPPPEERVESIQAARR